jgi:hypothetical protein
MRRTMILVLASLALAACESASADPLAPQPGGASLAQLKGDAECRGTIGADTIVGNLIVPDDATCTLNGTHVEGAITVKSRSTLFATGITSTGGIQGESARHVNIQNSEIGNNISLRKGGANTPAGDETVAVDIRGTGISGDIQVSDSERAVNLADNTTRGSIQVEKNVGGVAINGNRIGNALQCQQNNPSPTGTGNFAKQFQGQCAGMGTVVP